MRAVAALGCALVLVVACQPAGGPPSADPTATATSADGSPLGAPPAGMARTLSELTGRGMLVAEEWQDEPVLVEIEVDLNDQGQWQAARLVYVAAEAERFLALTAAGGGFTQEQPTLSTLQVPPLPEDAAAPRDVAASPEVEQCEVGAAPTVLYTTGAPVAWDGTTWTSPPQWRVTVTSADGGAAAAFDDVSASSARCLS